MGPHPRSVISLENFVWVQLPSRRFISVRDARYYISDVNFMSGEMNEKEQR